MFLAMLAVVAVIAASLGVWYWTVARRFVDRAGGALDGLVQSPVPGHLVFRKVSLWDGFSDHLQPQVSVEVRDGRVASIGPDNQVAAPGAVVVDGEGKTLMPGLIDTHVHLIHDSGPDLLTRAPALMREWMETTTQYPAKREAIVRRGQLKLKAGVTTMRILGDGYYALKYRDDLARWEVVGPRVLAAGLHVNGPNGYVSGGVASRLQPSLRAQAALELQRYEDIVPMLEQHIARGVDVVKIATTHGDLGFDDARSDLPESWVRRIVDVAHAHGLKVTAHSYGDDGDWAAIRGGVDGIEHLVNVPHPLSADMITAIRERGIVVCPTLAGSSYSVVRFLREPELLYEDPELAANVEAKTRRNLYMTLRVLRFPGVARLMMRKDRPLERWDSWHRHSLANTRALYEAGVRLVFGTDTPFPFGNFHYSVMGEVRALREAGLPNLEILRMATSRAAEVTGVACSVGSVAPGKTADLLLVTGDPLDNLEALNAVSMVVKEGRVVYRR